MIKFEDEFNKEESSEYDDYFGNNDILTWFSKNYNTSTMSDSELKTTLIQEFPKLKQDEVEWFVDKFREFEKIRLKLKSVKGIKGDV